VKIASIRTLSISAALILLFASAAFAASPKDDDLIHQYVSEGDRLRDSGHPAEAAAQYELALGFDETNVDVYARLSSTLVEAGNYERAGKICGRWIEIAPKTCAPRLELGLAYLRQGLVDQSVKAYEEALQFCPNDATAYASLARAYDGAHYPLEAIEAFRRSLELNPDDVSCYEALAKLYDDRALYPEAIGMYEAVLARPNHGKSEAWVSQAHARLATLYEWAHACERAIPHWEAVAASPSADAATKERVRAKIADCRKAHAPTGVTETGGTSGH
jgi:tetratricopeptide (TPR) repeat protein